MKKSKGVSSVGDKGVGTGVGGNEPVTLRRKDATLMPPPNKPAPVMSSPYAFMRRSCTFVAESSLGLRKSAARTSFTGQPPSTQLSGGRVQPVPQKAAKDRKNLALQVRKKKDMLEESTNGEDNQSDRLDDGMVGGGRMSRLVGGLRAWSSTEDVRQSFMGALGRTVSNMKQKPVSRRVKQAFTRPDSATQDTPSRITPAKPAPTRTTSTPITKSNIPKTKAKIKPTTEKPIADKIQQQRKADPVKFQFGKKPAGRCKSASSSTPADNNTHTNKAGHSVKSGHASSVQNVNSKSTTNQKWFRHIQEAQEAYTARDCRRHRPHPSTPLTDSEEQSTTPQDTLPDVEDNVEVEGGDGGGEGAGDSSSQDTSRLTPGSSRTSDQSKTDEASGQTSPPSPDTLAKKTELLRRKDLKIRQALEEKQLLIADILNIPHEHFDSVIDMAGEPTVGNKEPKELVLAAMFQAKCLQETLNEVLSINEGDIVAARASSDPRPPTAAAASSHPLYQAPISKLMGISSTLSDQLSSLLNLVSERDDERERMRKELVASRERLHQLHMRQNSSSQLPTVTPPLGAPPPPPGPAGSSPHTSRPNSFVSVASSTAEHSDTPEHHEVEEDGGGEGEKVNNTEESDQTKEEVVQENCDDPVTGDGNGSKSGDGSLQTEDGGEEGGGEASTT